MASRRRRKNRRIQNFLPSTSDGEETNMAQNGPFAVVVFYCDEGEGFEQYEWFQDATSLWGFITIVVEDGTSFDAVEFMLQGWNNGSLSTVTGGQGMFALNHIALGGHGTGATTQQRLSRAQTTKSMDCSVLVWMVLIVTTLNL